MTNTRGGEGTSVRPEDDDYDLLILAEAGVRLAEEIASVEKSLDAAVRERSPDAARLRSRLQQLHEARERNAPHRFDPRTFRDFFGYEP
jgi:hypothetical protein